MKGRRVSGILAIGLSMSLLLSGCTFMNKVADKVTKTDKETVVASSNAEGVNVATKAFDDTLSVPEFATNLSGSVSVVMNGSITLTVSATVADGGAVTYQWYSNNVNSNGGGTPIQGATAPSYMPNTSEGGKTYYYVVAINDHGETINEATSDTQEVVVWADMYWQQNADNKGFQYLSRKDGSYPSNLSMEIDGKNYTFNETGFAIDPATGGYIDVTTGQVIAASEPTPEATPTPEEIKAVSASSEQPEESTENTETTETTEETAADFVDEDGDGIPDETY
ncbi:MAG: hypothetical protein Q4B22_04280 [Eubacteriales bacterium]|nr:hypothetical protein [Eubacteriales bacterium]